MRGQIAAGLEELAAELAVAADRFLDGKCIGDQGAVFLAEGRFHEMIKGFQ